MPFHAWAALKKHIQNLKKILSWVLRSASLARHSLRTLLCGTKYGKQLFEGPGRVT